MTQVATVESAPGAAVEASNRTPLVQRLLRRKSFVVGFVGLALIVLAAIFAPLLASHDPISQDLSHSLAPPVWVEGGSWDHPFGTDTNGRDVASRMMYGARNSLLIAVFAVLISSVLGLLAGLSAGFSRGRLDALVMRFGDMQLAFPFILLAIVVLGIVRDRNVVHLILVLGIPGWILYARVVRSRVFAERDKDYVMAARSLGAGKLRQMRKYVLPSVWQVVLVIALLDFGFIILVELTLSFLGFGLSQPAPSWGSILAEGRKNMLVAPWLAVIPGIAIMLTVLAINLMADGVADVLDPKQKRGVFRRKALQAPTERQVRDAPASTSDVPWTAVAPPDPDGPPPLLDVRELSVEFPFDDRVVRAVRRVSLTVSRGETLGIVGESGSGKSVTALSIIQLLGAPGRVTGGQILFDGQDVARMRDAEVAALRGSRIGMIFQNPASSLNPVITTGSQMVETIRLHRHVSDAEARDLASRALLEVGIGDPGRVMGRFPFQLSGGMNQRIMIAMAMLARPDLLIADEPTTALDVTTQAQVLDRLRTITQEHHTALILITHDIALVRGYGDRVVVLYAGQVCESGPVEAVIRAPAHPYTQALLGSVPRADLEPDERLVAIPGELPDPSATQVGCPFAPRCRYAMDVCRDTNPPLLMVAPGRTAACHLDAIPDARDAVASALGTTA